MQEFSMVAGYMENLEKPQKAQNLGWALARVWVLAQDKNAVPKNSRMW